MFDRTFLPLDVASVPVASDVIGFYRIGEGEFYPLYRRTAADLEGLRQEEIKATRRRTMDRLEFFKRELKELLAKANSIIDDQKGYTIDLRHRVSRVAVKMAQALDECRMPADEEAPY